MTSINLSLVSMAFAYLFLLIPIVLIWRLHVPLMKRLAVSIGRMTLQLVLIALYLRYLFIWNSAVLNLLWLLIMVAVASSHILKSAHLRRHVLFASVLIAVLLSMTVVLLPLLIGVIRPEHFYEARYLIPLGGMLLGNCLSSTIIALDHYAHALRTRQHQLQTAFCFGATRYEATLPFLQEAFQRAMLPALTIIATMGLVSLPGMMTGQLLGGSFPIVAIKYQIIIMIAIVASSSLSIFLTLFMITQHLLDERDNVRLDRFGSAVHKPSS